MRRKELTAARPRGDDGDLNASVPPQRGEARESSSTTSHSKTGNVFKELPTAVVGRGWLGGGGRTSAFDYNLSGCNLRYSIPILRGDNTAGF